MKQKSGANDPSYKTLVHYLQQKDRDKKEKKYFMKAENWEDFKSTRTKTTS